MIWKAPLWEVITFMNWITFVMRLEIEAKLLRFLRQESRGALQILSHKNRADHTWCWTICLSFCSIYMAWSNRVFTCISLFYLDICWAGVGAKRMQTLPYLPDFASVWWPSRFNLHAYSSQAAEKQYKCGHQSNANFAGGGRHETAKRPVSCKKAGKTNV